MKGRKKPVFRLTIFFISVVLVSGSILAYLSINNISNLKELTEKRIQEEQLKLASEFRGEFEQELNSLVQKFSGFTDGKKPNQMAAYKPEDTLNLLRQVFLIDRSGKFLWPWFIEGPGKPSSVVQNKSYQYNFVRAERAEFIEEDFSTANKFYHYCLRTSNNKYDSVQALNAIARLSVKLIDPQKAIKYYSILISDYQGLCDPNGFPYVYYAIPQLIKISHEPYLNTVMEEIRICLSGMESGMIPLNQSTRNLLDQVRDLIITGIKDDFDPIPLKESIRIIDKQLAFIERNGEVIRRHLTGYDHDNTPKLSSGYQVLNGNPPYQDEMILLGAEEEYMAGFSILLEEFWKRISDGVLFPNADFEYEVNLFRSKNGFTGADRPLSTSLEISPYLPDYSLNIKLKDESLIDKFVRKRSWIYGITLILLLGGMIFGIMLILRDISREEHLARLRADFISNVTHELKTPLTSIQMFTESMALKRIKSEEDQSEYLSIILKETERLKQLINNILDFSRKEKGKREYHFKEVNISSLVLEVIDDLDYWLNQRSFSLEKEIQDNIVAQADPAALKQALINLLNNAIKFSVDRKEIAVRVRQEQKQILIQVEDKGIGIPDNQKDLIFVPFYRVEQKYAENISGTGLGLSVVKEVVAAHQGTISVNSRIDVGSIFTVRIDTNQENIL